MELLTLAPGSDRIPVELFQILKDDAVENAALNMQYALNIQYAGSRHSHPYMTTGKTIALTRQTFVGKVMSLLLNMLSRLVITFLPRSKRLLISWLQSPSAATNETQKYWSGWPIPFPADLPDSGIQSGSPAL